MVSRSIAAVATRRARERLLGISTYVVPALSLAIIWISLDSFVRGVDGFGFNPELVPTFAAVVGALAGLFGDSFAAALLADGPLALSIVAGTVPLVTVQAIQTAHAWAHERSAGAVDLVSLGPINPSGYLTGLFAADFAVSSIQLIAVGGAGATIAAIANLSIGSAFWLVLVAMFVFLVISLGLAALLASLLSSATATIVIYLGLLAFAVLSEIWLYAAVAAPHPAGLRLLGQTLGAISPVGGAANLLRASSAARAAHLAAGLFVGAAYVGMSHLILRHRRNTR